MDILHSLIDNLDDALVILDDEGRVLLFNEVATELSISLFTKSFTKGEHFADTVTLEISLACRELIESVQKSRNSEKYFTELKNRNGASVSLEFNFIPAHSGNGEVTNVCLHILDITSQKVFERKLATQAANISSLLDKANAVIIGVDMRGYITDWNEHCVRVTGFSKDEVFAQKLITVLLVDISPLKFEEMLAKAIRNEPAISEELLIRTKDGRLITLLLSCSHRLSSSGQAVGLTLVGQDMTELTEYRMALEMKVEERTQALKQALQKEKEAVEVKSRFVSIASH